MTKLKIHVARPLSDRIAFIAMVRMLHVRPLELLFGAMEVIRYLGVVYVTNLYYIFIHTDKRKCKA
jgi:hypothetical protein